MVASSENQEPLRATVRPLSLSMHELEVELRLPAEAVQKGAVAALPAWTPGSYLVRDYARFLDRVELRDARGRAVPLEKLDKQRWRIPPTMGPARLRYRVLAHDLTVRTNHTDASHAHLVGAATFLYLEGQSARPFEIRFEGFPAEWRVATALPQRRGAYRAADHDTLVDSPFELGTFTLHRFKCLDAEFEFAITGAHGADEARLLEGTRRIVEVCGGLFGGFPFQRYVFLLTFSPGSRGGLEHRDSTSLLADPHALSGAEGYHDLFLLIAHEFFHVWNVKRLRDAVLGPFDYARENPTRLLWFHEGLTSFMQYWIALNAGVVPWDWAARKLAALWTDNTNRAGRLEQSLEEASFDAWIRHYKPTEFTPNTGVSYYEKGAMVAWMMDARIRLASGGKRGLEALFAGLWKRFGDGPIRDADVRRAFRDLTKEDPAPFWEAWIQGRAELDPTAIERAYALRFQRLAPWARLSAEERQDPEAVRRARVFTGLVLEAQKPVIQNVLPDSPAAKAGLGYGMELLAVGGWRTTTARDAQQRLADARLGQRVEIVASEGGRVAHFRLKPMVDPTRTTQIACAPSASAAQRAAFRALAGQDFPAAGR